MMCFLSLFVIHSADAITFPSIGTITNYDREAIFSPDNRAIVTNSGSNVYVSNADTGSTILNIPSTLARPSATFNSDGSKLFVIGLLNDWSITLDTYNTKTGAFHQKLYTFKQDANQRSYINQFLLNAQETISYVLVNTRLYVVDNSSGSVIETVTYASAPQLIVYNAKTNELIVALRDQLNVLNGNNAQFKKSIPLALGNYNYITDATFDADGNTLYVAAQNIALVAFDASNNYQSIPFVRNEFPGSASVSSTKSITISPNNLYLLLSGDTNYRTSVYERLSGKKVTDLSITSSVLAFSPDNRKLIIGRSLYDSSQLIPKKITKLQIEHPKTILIGQIADVGLFGLTDTNEKVPLDSSVAEWTISNPAVLTPYYGKFSGQAAGSTTVTVSYNGLTTSFPITVVAPFKDIASTHSNATAIYYMLEQNIITGYGDGTFRPSYPIPRHHVAAMVGRSGIPLPTIRPAKSFTDVTLRHANYDNIQKLYRAGIIDGSGNAFKPNNNITHIQLAKILTNLFNFQKANSTTYRFSDVATSNWGYPFAEIMVSNGIMPMTNGKFNANTTVTRGQFSQYFYNALMKAK